MGTWGWRGSGELYASPENRDANLEMRRFQLGGGASLIEKMLSVERNFRLGKVKGIESELPSG